VAGVHCYNYSGGSYILGNEDMLFLMEKYPSQRLEIEILIISEQWRSCTVVASQVCSNQIKWGRLILMAPYQKVKVFRTFSE